MKRFACLVLTMGCLLAAANGARADWGSCSYGGYQPWWNIFAHRPCLTCEEERLQRFWHDYYDALRRYYGMLDHMDWVSYYKNHGYQINSGCGGPGGSCGGSSRVQFAPVFVSPAMQWAVPNNCLSGPPNGPGGAPMGAFGMGGGFPGYGMGMPPLIFPAPPAA